eukprot:TRINITY_DN10177_c0_g1_i2.p3 TRINITY_DN10177_c0_g1~~TRINITY_DN10177_c0_g1_i2.p3  ORF type:complete len:242 (+),score=-3.45 TRINITY_DN10177_c0_g1_i2:774-1499(+)
MKNERLQKIWTGREQKKTKILFLLETTSIRCNSFKFLNKNISNFPQIASPSHTHIIVPKVKFIQKNVCLTCLKQINLHNICYSQLQNIGLLLIFLRPIFIFSPQQNLSHYCKFKFKIINKKFVTPQIHTTQFLEFFLFFSFDYFLLKISFSKDIFCTGIYYIIFSGQDFPWENLKEKTSQFPYLIIVAAPEGGEERFQLYSHFVKKIVRFLKNQFANFLYPVIQKANKKNLLNLSQTFQER